MGRIAPLALGLWLLGAGAALAHGVTWTVLDERPVAVRFGYAGGEPMSYVEVLVFGPQSPPDLEFQNGRTDARGVFAFLPDGPGAWIVQAKDESGHRGQVEVAVDTAGAAAPGADATPARGASPARVGLGLSLLANLGLGAALLRRRRRA